jgi:hypothetical protein
VEKKNFNVRLVHVKNLKLSINTLWGEQVWEKNRNQNRNLNLNRLQRCPNHLNLKLPRPRPRPRPRPSPRPSRNKVYRQEDKLIYY